MSAVGTVVGKIRVLCDFLDEDKGLMKERDGNTGWVREAMVRVAYDALFAALSATAAVPPDWKERLYQENKEESGNV